jgi:hypothetical protein
MELNCIRCKQAFDSGVARGYCDACVEHFKNLRKGIRAKQNPRPDVFADGQFAQPKECPESVLDPARDDLTVCGLCGSEELESGYGLGSGYGMGSYNWCHGCHSFLDFSEDRS